jgi:hypothetical protein
MPPSLFALAAYATLLLPVSDVVPTLNVEPSCRAAAKMGDSLDATLQSCMRDEREARTKLETEWSQFPADNRARCVATTQTGGTASYVEVLTCLEMARDAAKDEKARGNRGL